MRRDFTQVTELSGQMISQEQLTRMLNRYQWASTYVHGKDVLELACGAGQGLSLLSSKAKSVTASDIDPSIVDEAIRNNAYTDVGIHNFSADNIPFSDASFDVVLLFESIYYLPNIQTAISEISRVLRSDGVVLIATANPDLFDFVKSPNSVRYYGKAELSDLLTAAFPHLEFFGFVDVTKVALRQRLLRPLKAILSKMKLLPGDMKSKEILKRVFFGRLIPMPRVLTSEMGRFIEPDALRDDDQGKRHKVIYCMGRKK